jgi:hypothetical protein
MILVEIFTDYRSINMTSIKLAALAALAVSVSAFANPPTDQTTTTTESTTSSSTTTTTVPDFKSLDTNKDGMVSKDEAAANVDLSAQFDTLDADRNGSLSTSEYAKGTTKEHAPGN